jgi:glycosyltransferase involved in cell wall biosynthesis
MGRGPSSRDRHDTAPRANLPYGAGITVRIALVIRALGLGGAERQLVQLASGLSGRGHSVTVFTFYEGWEDRERSLLEAGVNLTILRKRGRWDVLGFAASLRKSLASCTPDVLYSFLPTSNVIAALVLPRRTRIALVWGIRASVVQSDSYDWLGRLINRLEGWMSALPDRIIANSRSGMMHLLSRGFPESKLRYVPNGVDTSLFRFDADARRTLRHDWGIDGLIIGFAGRVDPMKGLPDLFTALSRSTGSLAQGTLVIAGTGNEQYVRHLTAQLDGMGLHERVRWLGPVTDMTSFYSAIDILCLPSYGEGTSNVVAEALACGCPCVVTEVGDLVSLIGDRQLVAQPGDPRDLLRALNCAVDLAPHLERESLRSRVVSQLAWPTVIEATEQVFQQAVASRRRCSVTLDAMS